MKMTALSLVVLVLHLVVVCRAAVLSGRAAIDSVSPVAPAYIDPVTNVIEEAAIRRVENFYFLSIDSKHFDGLSQIFTPDVYADYGPGIGVVEGEAALTYALNAS